MSTPYKREITQRSVLEEALQTHEGLLELMSKGCRKLEPVKGMERRFEEEQRKCEILRGMIRALRSENVRQAMADWQREEMTGEKQRGLFANYVKAEWIKEAEPVMKLKEMEDGHTEGNVPDHPEGQ